MLSGLLLWACSSADVDGGHQLDDDGAASGGESGMVPDEVAFDLLLDAPGTLALGPKDVTQLTVVVEPPRGQLVTFELLSEEADFDGFLFEGSTMVDEGGRGSVRLQAPSKRSSFWVRASLGTGASALLPVSVSSTGYGSLRVQPDYEGHRQIETWTASASVNVSCEELADFWSDGPLAASDEDRPLVQLIPADTTVAVVLRGDQLVSGCTTVTDLDQDEVRDLTVRVSDRPVLLDQGELSLVFGLQETTLEFAADLAEAIEEGKTQLVPEDFSTAERLLEFMALQLGSAAAPEFSDASEREDFPALLDSAWSGQDPILARFGDLMTRAAESIVGPSAFEGTLTLRGTASRFELTQVAGVNSQAALFHSEGDWMMSREAGDVVALGGQLSYSPLALLLAIFERDGGREAILDAAECSEVARTLDSVDSVSVLDECGESCLLSLCEDATHALMDSIDPQSWETTISFSASATASVSDGAEIAALEGTWIGRLDAASDMGQDAESALRGPVSGTRTIP